MLVCEEGIEEYEPSLFSGDNVYKYLLYFDLLYDKFTDKTIFKYLRHEDTFYDRKSGWLCFGNKKIEVIDDVIEIMENVCVVLRDDWFVIFFLKRHLLLLLFLVLPFVFIPFLFVQNYSKKLLAYR